MTSIVSGTSGYTFPDGTTQTTAATQTNPAGSTGQVQYNDAGAFGAISSGTSGQVLTSAGAGSAPSWTTISTDVTGDISFSKNTTKYVTPDWLPCNSSQYSSTTYSTLNSTLGVSDFDYDYSFQKVPVSTVWTGSIYVSAGFDGISTSSDGTTWTLKVSYPNISGEIINIAYDGATKIAVSVSVGIYYSTDTGATWTFTSCGGAFNSSTPVRALAYIGTNFVAMGGAADSYGYAYYSSNFTSWTQSTGFTSSSASRVLNGRLMSWSNQGTTFCYSTNGVTFTSATCGIIPTNMTYVGSYYYASNGTSTYYSSAGTSTWANTTLASGIWAVGYLSGSSKYVAMSSNGNAYYSTAGTTTWTTVSTSITSQVFNYASSESVIVAQLNGIDALAYSTNGTSWTVVYIPNLNKGISNLYRYPQMLTYTNSKFLISGMYSLFSSTNGSTWTQILNNFLNINIYKKNEVTFVKKATNGTITVYPCSYGVATTTDDITFTFIRLTGQSSGSMAGVVWNGTVFVTGNNGDTFRYYSTDGITWTTVSVASSTIDIAVNGSTIVALGPSYLYTSTDGATWTQRASVTSPSTLNYVNGYFIQTTTQGTYQYSTDGTTWTAGPSQDNRGFSYISIANNRLYGWSSAYGNRLTFIDKATNLATECTISTPTMNSIFYSVAYGNGVYVMCGGNNTMYDVCLYYSVDGINFKGITPPQGMTSSNQIISVTFANGLFVATTSQVGAVFTSKDGLSWTEFSFNKDVGNSNFYCADYGTRWKLINSNAGTASQSTATLRTPMITSPAQAFIKT